MGWSMAAAFMVGMLARKWWVAIVFGTLAALVARILFIGYVASAGVSYSQTEVIEALIKTALSAPITALFTFAVAQARRSSRHTARPKEPKPGPWRSS